MDLLKPLADDLWFADAPLRFVGLEVGTRMTVVRLPSGELWLHSPIPPNPQLQKELGALGPVTTLVAPNQFHHLFVGDWKTPFPEARIYVAPGLERKRPELAIAGVLSDSPPAAWSDVLDQKLLAGLPWVNEVAFLHRPSGTLVSSDLAFHIQEHSPPLTRWAFRLMGAYGRLAHTPIERFLVRDRAAFAEALEAVLSWPFERMVMAHGEVVEAGAREALAEIYAWVLAPHRRGARADSR